MVWYVGPIILFTKGAQLANDAFALEPQSWGRSISWVAGIIVGIIKTRYIFLRSNRKNLARIDALESPKLWQFYRIPFYFALASMVMLGAFLSRASQGNHTFLVFVATLDISIGTALLLSSVEFWKQGVFTVSKNHN